MFLGHNSSLKCAILNTGKRQHFHATLMQKYEKNFAYISVYTICLLFLGNLA